MGRSNSNFAWRAFTMALVLPLVAIGQSALPIRGDYLIVSRTYGSIYAVNPADGLIRCLVSGQELRQPPVVIRGAGPSLAGSFATALLPLRGGAVLARFGAGAGAFGLHEVSPISGNRVLMPGTSGADWDEAGELLPLDESSVLSTADAWNAPGMPQLSYGRVLRYDLKSGATTIISGPTVGDGPLFKRPRAMCRLDANTLLVIESGFSDDGIGAFKVDLQTGNRTFLSRLSRLPISRSTIVAGQPGPDVTLGDDEGGAGPILSTEVRTAAYENGRLMVGGSVSEGAAYYGALIQLDPGTGDRTLLVGRAFVDDGIGNTFVIVNPSNAGAPSFSGPSGLTPRPDGKLVFCSVFVPRIFQFDPGTTELLDVARLGLQVLTNYRSNLNFSGLAIYPGHRGDLDCDGNVNVLDINAFVLALFDAAAYAAAYPACDRGLADIDGDGQPTVLDINPFVSLLLTGE